MTENRSAISTEYLSENPELRFLLAESRRDPSETTDRLISVVHAADFDHRHLNSLIIKNHLSPIVAENLRRQKLTDEVFRPVFQDADAFRLQSIRLAVSLAQIFSLFQKHGIKAISLKGPLLAQELYGNISLRYCGDLDILVDPENYIKARTLLLENGFHPEDCVTTEKQLGYLMHNPVDHHTILAKSGVVVELHWKSLHLEPASFDELYKRCTAGNLCGTEIPVLCRPDCIGLLIRHGVQHGFYNLRWLTDLYELILHADEQELQQVCSALSEYGYLFSFLTAILLLKQFGLLQVRIEDARETAISKPENDTVLVKTPLDGGAYKMAFRLSQASAQLALTTEDPLRNKLWNDYTVLYRKTRYEAGVADKADEFLKLVSPGPQEFQLVRFPDALFFLYYPLRVLYWLFRHLRSGNHRG